MTIPGELRPVGSIGSGLAGRGAADWGYLSLGVAGPKRRNKVNSKRCIVERREEATEKLQGHTQPLLRLHHHLRHLLLLRKG